MKFSKFIIFGLISSMLLMNSVLAIKIAPPKEPAGGLFPDVDSYHANYEAIDYLKDTGVVKGYVDGEFKPDREISRAEFLKIVMEAGSIPGQIVTDDIKENCFEDSKGHWGEEYICTAVDEGIIEGYADGSFRPNAEINFVEAGKIVAEVMDLSLDDEGTEWFDKYVNALVDEKAVPDTIDGFDEEITRGEMSEMVWRIKEDQEDRANLTYGLLKDRGEAREEIGKLSYFDSCTDLTRYFENTVSDDYGYFGDDVMMEKSVAMPVSVTSNAAAGLQADMAVEAEEAAAPASDEKDYSTTNVQVAGVDEADIVKNDGEYVYLLKGNEVRIVKATPANDMEEMDKVTFKDDSFYATDMYVDGDYLTVIGSTYSDEFDYYSSGTRVYVLDIEERDDVEVFRDMVFKGNEVSTRKVEDTLYLVLNDYNYFYHGDVVEPFDVLPTVMEDEELISDIGCGDMLYYPGEFETSKMIIAGVDLTDKDADVEIESIVGGSGTVYASRNSIYVAEPSYNYGWWGGNNNKEETVVHKFSLEDGIDYMGKGSVPGNLLNQFSMDESDGYFRVATTKGDVWNDETKSTNNIYVLDEDMELVGALEGVAPGERIYSVRFMGEKAYMVTFKKVDPFFVIDLSNPRNPNILGELKLPGYSDYLHPFGDDYVIGFGKDAVDASAYDKWNRDLDFAWYQGMKVAMFDVSDVTNPQVLHSMVIGDRGTESELLYNHKALMFDEKKGLMAFPISISEIPEDIKNDKDTPADAYGKQTFEGAVAFEVSVKDGFEEIGRVSHVDEDDRPNGDDYWYPNYNSKVLRALYIGDYLYTVSNNMVKANELDDFNHEYEVVFDGVPEEEYYYEY